MVIYCILKQIHGILVFLHKKLLKKSALMQWTSSYRRNVITNPIHRDLLYATKLLIQSIVSSNYQSQTLPI
jgi:hypothetical protein